jgi:hypothetical protein
VSAVFVSYAGGSRSTGLRGREVRVQHTTARQRRRPRRHRDGVGNGTFTVLTSDHCSFMYEDAEKGKKSIFSVECPEGKLSKIPNGGVRGLRLGWRLR